MQTGEFVALDAGPRLLAELRAGSHDARALVVNLSYDAVPRLRHVDFGLRTIDLADRSGRYFLLQVGPALDLIQQLIRDYRLQRLCFVGLSKGGFGALLLSRVVAEQHPDLVVGALAFAPLTRLWPIDRKIKFPSYAALLRAAATNPELVVALERHGDQSRDASLPNLRWIVAYGVRKKVDAAQALALTGSSVTLLPVPLSGHGAFIPFLCQRQPPEIVEQIVAAAARNGETHPDLKIDHTASDQARMLAEIRAMLPLPTVPELVAHAIGTAPR